MIVNHGVEPITYDDLHSAQFTTASSSPNFAIYMAINVTPNSDVPPILPGEAVGGVTDSTSLFSNAVFNQQVRPSETLRNTQSHQFFVGFIERVGVNMSVGWMAEKILITMGDRAVSFVIHVNLHLESGQFGLWNLQFLHATRVISVPLTDPVQTRTWGRVRELYR